MVFWGVIKIFGFLINLFLSNFSFFFQEQVAEEMLSLTKTLKEQSLAAKDVILKDTAVIEKTAEMADKNTERLKKEADRLGEHTKSSCRCWIWSLLGIVIMTFVSMVWVMKFFRKRKDYWNRIFFYYNTFRIILSIIFQIHRYLFHKNNNIKVKDCDIEPRVKKVEHTVVRRGIKKFKSSSWKSLHSYFYQKD